MAQSSGMNNNSMKWSQKNHPHESYGDAFGYRMHTPFARKQSINYAVVESPAGRMAPLAKPSHQTFLNWVAYTRNLDQNIHEIERRTCPLLQCELCFDNTNAMLEHVKNCPRLTKGRYRCFESGKEERIGRCDTKSCHELQQCTDRIVNSLRRRLSPRGSRPRHLAGVISDKQSLSPEMPLVDSSLNDSYPIGFAELSCENEVPVPELDANCVPDMTTIKPPPPYTLMNPGYTANVDTSFSSGDYSLHAPLSSVPQKNMPAELDVGEAASYTLAYPKQSFAEYPEQGVRDNLLQMPQSQAQGRYEPVVLEPCNSSSYAVNNAADAPPQQPHTWLPGSSSSQNSPRTWSQGTSNSSQPSLTSDHDLDMSFREAFQSVAAPQYNEPISPIAQDNWDDGFPATYNIPSMENRMNTDGMQVNCGFSPVSGLSVRDSSISSLESVETPADITHELPRPFLGESDRMCSEPEEIDQLMLSPNNPHQSPHTPGTWESHLNNGTFLAGSPQTPHDHFAAIQSHGLQALNHNRIPRKPIPAPSPRTGPPKRVLSPDINYLSPKRLPTSVGKPWCTHCRRPFKDKSNLKRHELRCEKNPRKIGGKPYKCNWPRCGRGYARSDGLVSHQTKKGHEGKVEFSLETIAASSNLDAMFGAFNEYTA